jgi:AcrR family transcriptional regulator
MTVGQLIRQRARGVEQKEERRQVILDAGRALLEDAAVSDVKMADVAGLAKLAKGTVFLYFPTKEALCLDVLGELVDEWFDALDVALARSARLGVPGLVKLLMSSLEGRGLLIRLTAIISTVLERNVEVDRIVAFKARLLRRLATTGGTIDKKLSLADGEGARLFLRLNTVVVGLHQVTDLGPAAREALSRPELAPFVRKFDEELPVLLAALMRGLLERAS